jgi:hypothetical protein
MARKIIAFALVSLLALSFATSQASAFVSLTFSSVTTPSTIGPGDRANILLTIENGGNEFAGNAKLTIGSNQYVTPDVSTFNLGSIAAGGTAQISIPVSVSPNAPEGSIVIPFSISYTPSDTSNLVTTENSVSIFVTKRTIVQIANVTYDIPEIERGDSFKMSVLVRNAGKGTLQDLTVSLRNFSAPISPVSSDTERFVGNLAPGQTSLVVFDLIANPEAR